VVIFHNLNTTIYYIIIIIRSSLGLTIIGRTSRIPKNIIMTASKTVKELMNKGRKLTQIRGVTYDITDFASRHPGGKQLMMLAHGRDSTILFESHHLRSDVVAKVLKTLPIVKVQSIGNDDDDDNWCPNEEFPKPLDSELYLKIQNRVRTEVVDPIREKSGKKARGAGGVQFDAFCVILCYLVAVYMFNKNPSVLTGVFLGFSAYWSGTGLQHTANHGGLTQSGFMNAIWGWFGCDVILGKSSIEWRYHHMVSHHSYCNESTLDQDVYTSHPLMRLDEAMEWKWFHKYQAFYSVLAWPFLYFAAQSGDFVNVVITKSSPGVKYLGLMDHEVALFYIGRALHYLTIYALPMYNHGVKECILPIIAYATFGSFILCWFFIVSHNLDGLTPAAMPKKAQKDWAEWQIRTSASWGESIWSFLSGGLNLQIEHHLFPGMAHNLYPKIVPIVKEECAKAGVPYHGHEGVFGLIPITYKMFSFLHKMGKNPNNINNNNNNNVRRSSRSKTPVKAQ
jgi:acyl-lipid (7-3)-desaturase (Delta-4 desaturase)